MARQQIEWLDFADADDLFPNGSRSRILLFEFCERCRRGADVIRPPDYSLYHAGRPEACLGRHQLGFPLRARAEHAEKNSPGPAFFTTLVSSEF
jgi:hypothetical protein